MKSSDVSWFSYRIHLGIVCLSQHQHSGRDSSLTGPYLFLLGSSSRGDSLQRTENSVAKLPSLLYLQMLVVYRHDSRQRIGTVREGKTLALCR